jgi:hypothetical protein
MAYMGPIVRQAIRRVTRLLDARALDLAPRNVGHEYGAKFEHTRSAGFQPAGPPASCRRLLASSRRLEGGEPAGWKPALH